MKFWPLLAALFTAAAPAHADPLANWEGTRWLLESESLLPVAITLVAKNNEQLWTNALQSEVVITCNDVESVGKKAVVVTCDIDAMALRVVSRYSEPTDVVRKNTQIVLDEITERMAEAQIQVQLNNKGRITRVEVPGLTARDNRIRQSNEILRIDANTGRVTAVVDASGLLTTVEAMRADVLNGIAYRPENETFLLTGKLWPHVFEVELIPR